MKVVSLLTSALFLLPLGLGCNKPTDAEPAAEFKVVPAQERRQAIENNPNLSPEQKQRMLSTLEQGEAVGKQYKK